MTRASEGDTRPTAPFTERPISAQAVVRGEPRSGYFSFYDDITRNTPGIFTYLSLRVGHSRDGDVFFDQNGYWDGAKFMLSIAFKELERTGEKPSTFDTQDIKEMMDRVSDTRNRGKTSRDAFIDRRFLNSRWGFLRILKHNDRALFDRVKDVVRQYKRNHGRPPTDWLFGVAEVYFQYRPELAERIVEFERGRQEAIQYQALNGWTDGLI